MTRHSRFLRTSNFKRFIALGVTCSAALVGAAAFAQPSAGAGTGAEPGREDSIPAQDPVLDSAHVNPKANQSSSGFEWGLGVGVGLPLGDADAGLALYNDDRGNVTPLRVRSGGMDGIASYRVPLGLDLGYRLSDVWWVGAKVQAGLGGFGDECPTGARCHFTDARLLAWLEHHLRPRSAVDPWLGIGLGYEWLSTVAQVSLEPADPDIPFYQSLSATQELSGPLLMAQAGLGFDLGEQLRVGPFIGGAVGRFIWSSFDCAEGLGCPRDGAIDGGGFHAWLSVGVKGSHGP